MEHADGTRPTAVWLGTGLVPSGTAEPWCADQGLLRGWGVFETMLAVGDCVPAWPQHWQRLDRGAHRLGIPLLAQEFVRAAVEQTVQRALHPAAEVMPVAREPRRDGTQVRLRVRLTLTAGAGAAVTEPGAWPGLLITASPCEGPQPWEQQAGVRLRTYPDPFETPLALRGCKHTSYLPWLMAARWAEQHGADEALLVGTTGQVSETSRRNVFAWWEGRLWTAPLSSGCLPGVTRERVLALAQQHGLDISQEPLTRDALRAAEYLMLTSAVSGMQWVSEWDGRPLLSPAREPRLWRLVQDVHAAMIGG